LVSALLREVEPLLKAVGQKKRDDDVSFSLVCLLLWIELEGVQTVGYDIQKVVNRRYVLQVAPVLDTFCTLWSPVWGFL
jgi:hypothetical protein